MATTTANEPLNAEVALPTSTESLKKRMSRMVSDIGRHEVLLLAGSLAYTTALALAPFVIIMLSLASFLPDELQNRFYTAMKSAAGDRAGAAVQMIVENADKHPSLSGISGIIGFVVLAISASAIFSALKVVLDKVNEHKEGEGSSGVLAFVKDKFLSVGLVFGFAFLSIVSLMVTTALAVVFSGAASALWETVSFVVSFLLFALLFTAIYRFVPSDRLSWKRCAIAGGVSACFYLIGKFAIGLYLGKAGLESAYGAAGSLIVFLAWVYYTGLTLLVSYEFTTHLVLKEEEPAEKNRPTAPSTSAQPVMS